MATYRFEAKIIGRKNGYVATASAAYRAGELIPDERTGQVFDYTRKGGVLHSELITPAGTPEWMKDRAELWNAVEKVEKRKDAQLARDLVISLPHELTHAQRVELMREFVSNEFVAHGMIADISIHAPDRQGDPRNHHAHVMLTMRELTADGFGNKARDWNRTELLEQWREDWANTVNRHLERYGHEARVDHRSLADQGIDREPEPKLGPVATEMERQGRPSLAGDDRRAAQARNQERAELAAEVAALDGKIIDLLEERARRAEQTNQAAAEPPPAAAPGYTPNFVLIDEAGRISGTPPGPPEPPREPSSFVVDRRDEPTATPQPEPSRSRAQTHGGSIFTDMLDLVGEVVHEALYVAREVGREAKFVAAELRRDDSAEKLTEFAAREAAKREGEQAPRTISAAEMATDSKARREYYAQKAAERERTAAIDRLQQDVKAGRNLDADAVRKLSRADLIEIRDKGDDALRRLISDREKELQRQRDYDGRVRER